LRERSRNQVAAHVELGDLGHHGLLDSLLDFPLRDGRDRQPFDLRDKALLGARRGLGTSATACDLGVELASLMPELFALFEEGLKRGLQLIPGNNIGYFGPYEAAWRSTSGRPEYYGGCQAGRAGLGIEADGAIKGCPSLPTAAYVGGNIRDKPFAEIWSESAKLGFMRDAFESRARRWGFCGKCYYGPVCRGGCSWTTHVLTAAPAIIRSAIIACCV
jgi:radical SAM protein with 4Fe4S-binding SPASM domain